MSSSNPLRWFQRKRRIDQIVDPNNANDNGGVGKIGRSEPEVSLFERTMNCDMIAEVIDTLDAPALASMVRSNKHMEKCLTKLARQNVLSQQKWNLVGLITAVHKMKRAMQKNVKLNRELREFIVSEMFVRTHQNFRNAPSDIGGNKTTEQFIHLGRNIVRNVILFWFDMPVKFVPFFFSKELLSKTVENPLTSILRFHVGSIVSAAVKLVLNKHARPHFLNERQYLLLHALGELIRVLDHNVAWVAPSASCRPFMDRLIQLPDEPEIRRKHQECFIEAVNCIVEHRDLSLQRGNHIHSLVVRVFRAKIHLLRFQHVSPSFQADLLQRFRHGQEHANAMEKMKLNDRHVQLLFRSCFTAPTAIDIDDPRVEEIRVELLPLYPHIRRSDVHGRILEFFASSGDPSLLVRLFGSPDY